MAIGLLALAAAWVIARLGQRDVAVEAGEIAQRVVARATIVVADGVTRVVVDAPSVVLEVHARPGDEVKEGQALAAVESVDPGGRRRADLTAPRSGTVLSCNLVAGDAVSPSSELAAFELADLSQLEVVVELDERDATKVARGHRLELRPVGGGASLAEAVIDRLAPTLEARAGLGGAHASARPVRLGWARLAGADGLLVGQLLEAVIALPPLAVDARLPRETIAVEDGRVVVRMAGAVFDRRQVVTLGASDERFVAVSGLPAEARVLLP
jgi:multidrug efflux pump subunit AcrA (membrane-fusion protein)